MGGAILENVSFLRPGNCILLLELQFLIDAVLEKLLIWQHNTVSPVQGSTFLDILSL